MIDNCILGADFLKSCAAKLDFVSDVVFFFDGLVVLPLFIYLFIYLFKTSQAYMIIK